MLHIKAHNISFAYGNKQIFTDVSFDIVSKSSQGHIVGIMGPSGTGKSTLLKLLLKLEKPTGGTLTIDPKTAIVSYLPQEPVLFDHLSPLQNAELFRNTAKTKSLYNADLFTEVLEALELSDVLTKSRKINQLSGGEKQRLALLRAISLQPSILIMDEPTTGLDAAVKAGFLLKLKELVVKYNILVFYVTHNNEEAELISNEILYIEDCQVSKSSIQEIKKLPPTLNALYAFNHPVCNVIKYSLHNGSISLSDSADAGYLYVQDGNITLTKDFGFNFRSIAENGIYQTIQIEDTNQTMVLFKEQIKDHMRLVLQGSCLAYDSRGKYQKSINIIDNKVEI